MHDLNGATFIEPVTLGFFEQSDFARRRDQANTHMHHFLQKPVMYQCIKN